MKLGRTFFSLYFLIIAVFIFFSWLLDEVWSSYIEQDIESYTGYKTMLEAISDYAAGFPEEEWENIINRSAEKYQLPLSLQPIKEVEQADRQDRKSLRKGKTLVFYKGDDVWIDHIMPDNKTVIELGPAKMPTRPRIEAVIRVIILATFGVLVFFWLWPLSKDLDELKKATKRFGDGEFDAVAPDAQSGTIRPMIKTFNMMSHRIKRLIEGHKELSSAVAHELRTPLARSRFALQMLGNLKDEAKREKYTNQIESDIAELEELINEMLVYASFDSDKPELNIREHKLLDIVQGQANNFKQFDGELLVAIKEDLPEVLCDRHFIERALSNYISNAIKYGKDKILLTAGVEEGYAYITVEDNGEGLSDQFKEKAFDAFSRADEARNKDVGGFGLGLAIVSRVMEWHQGKVIAEESDNLGGAQFTIRWPTVS